MIFALACSASPAIIATKFLGLQTLLIFVRSTLKLVAGSSFPFFLFETIKKLIFCFFSGKTIAFCNEVSFDCMSCAETVIEKELITNAMMVFVGFITVDLSFYIKPISPTVILIIDDRIDLWY